MKKLSLDSFVRQDISDMKEYVPARSAWDLAELYKTPVEDLIKLDANENAYGTSPVVNKIIAECKLFHRYSDPQAKMLRSGLSQYTGLKPEYIAVGSGSDELIDLLYRLLLEPGDEIIDAPPTFSMYAITVVLNRGKIIAVPRKKDFSLDMPAMVAAVKPQTKIIMICNPNNPTGTLSPLTNIEQLLKTGKLVIVDEAYYEYSGITAISLLERYENLLILRTMSKAAGLAGLRIGYGLMHPYFVNQIMKIKPPFNVNLAAHLAAITTLTNPTFIKNTTHKVVAERQRIYAQLLQYNNIKVFPSAGNYLFIKITERQAQQARSLFDKMKVAIRYFKSTYYGFGLRITVGKPEQNEKVLQILKQI